MGEPRYFEDFSFGETFATDSYEVTFEEAVGFAKAAQPVQRSAASHLANHIRELASCGLSELLADRPEWVSLADQDCPQQAKDG